MQLTSLRKIFKIRSGNYMEKDFGDFFFLSENFGLEFKQFKQFKQSGADFGKHVDDRLKVTE